MGSSWLVLSRVLSVVVVVVGTLTGCDRVFGVGDRAPSVDAAADAPAPVAVTGSFGYHMFVNDPISGDETESEVVYGEDNLAVSVILDDDSTPRVSYDAENNFSFARATATQAYRLTVQPIAGVPTEYQDTADTVTLRTPYFGRVARTAPAVATNLVFAVTLPAPAPVVARNFVTSTNLRTLAAAAPTEAGSNAGNFTYDYHGTASLFGGVGLLDHTQGDRLWYTAFAVDASAKWESIVASYEDVALLMKSGASNAIAGAAAATPQSRCVALTAPRRTELNRLEATTGFSTTESATWQIQATPNATLSPSAGLEIVGTNIGTPTDEVLQIQYANPYPEDQIVVMVTEVQRRPVLTGTTAGSAVGYLTEQYAIVPTLTAATCMSAPVALTTTIGIPANPTIAGTLLTTDNTPVDLDRSGPVMLTFAPLDDSPVDDYVVTLFLVANSGGVTTWTTVRVYSVLTPSVAIAPSLLTPGSSYMLQIESRLGYPNAAQRDYSVIGYPFAAALFYSSIFLVNS